MNLDTTNNKIQKVEVNGSTRMLLNGIHNGSKGVIFNELCRYKERGQVLPVRVIEQIPLEDRLPALSQKYGRGQIVAVLSVALTNCFEKMNLRKDMSGEQIVELAEEILNSSEEDQLAIEDVMLFLEGLTRAKYGKIYDRMDIPTFFEMFEIYRENRHQQYKNLLDEQNSQFKAIGDTRRASDEFARQEHETALKAYQIALEQQNRAIQLKKEDAA